MMNFSSSYSAGGEPHEVVQHGSAGTQLSVKSWSIVGQLKGLGVEMISRSAYIDPHNIYVDMPKQNDQKCNKCRQKRQHAEKDTFVSGFVPLAETLGFFWSSPKGTIQNRAAERTRCGGGHRGIQGRPNLCTFTSWDLKIDAQKLFLDKASPLEKELFRSFGWYRRLDPRYQISPPRQLWYMTPNS